MGFFYKGMRGNKILFEVHGEDIIYALQFPETKWCDEISISLPKFDYNFRKNHEYFLKIEDGNITCVWDYEEFVPNYPKIIDEAIVENRLKKMKMTDDQLIKKVSEYKQPIFPFRIECDNIADGCFSKIYPLQANHFSCLYYDDEDFPDDPYFCEECLECPPILKNEN